MASAPSRNWIAAPSTLAGLDGLLAQQGTLLRRVAGDRLFRAGQVPKHMFFLCHGEVRLQRTTQTGEDVCFQRCTGGFIAEASLTSAAYHCDALCRGPSELLALACATLRRAIDTDPALRWAWIDLLSAQSRRQRVRIERLALKTIPERLRHLIHTEGEAGMWVLDGTRKELAADLGVTPEALYRALAALVAQGSLTISGSRFSWRGARGGASRADGLRRSRSGP